MNVVKFPAPVSERFELEQEFDTLRFDIQCAHLVAERLRMKSAETMLASNVARESIENSLIHLGSLIAFISELKDRMDGQQASSEEIPAHIRQSWLGI